jgi:aromatase
MQDGRRVSWNTQRRYFDAIHRIDYHLPVPMPFLESMNGQWRVVPVRPGHCLLTVNRSWRLLADVGGIREGVNTVAQASAIVDAFVNENAQTEMQAIRAFVEGGGDAFTSFTTSYRLPHPPDEVYRVLADAAHWPEVLPHCESLKMVYDDAQYQEFLMRVRTPRGVETFRSIRRCNPDELSIHYFQPEPPAVLRTHHGSWQVKSAPGGGSEVFSHHDIQLNRDACVAAFGDADVRLHKRRIKELVIANSGTTSEACKRWLEARQGGAAAPAELREALV